MRKRKFLFPPEDEDEPYWSAWGFTEAFRGKGTLYQDREAEIRGDAHIGDRRRGRNILGIICAATKQGMVQGSICKAFQPRSLRVLAS